MVFRCCAAADLSGAVAPSVPAPPPPTGSAGFNTMHRGVLITVYFLFMCWLFLGISVVSDLFFHSVRQLQGGGSIVLRRQPGDGWWCHTTSCK